MKSEVETSGEEKRESETRNFIYLFIFYFMERKRHGFDHLFKL